MTNFQPNNTLRYIDDYLGDGCAMLFLLCTSLHDLIILIINFIRSEEDITEDGKIYPVIPMRSFSLRNDNDNSSCLTV